MRSTAERTISSIRLMLVSCACQQASTRGRPYGAVAGGLAIGLCQELATYHWFSAEPFVNPGYKPAVAFSVMVIMLIWRPTGLFRGRVF